MTVSLPPVIVEILTSTELYPFLVEVTIVGAGLLLSLWTTYRFNKMIYFSSKRLFGVLTRHFRALFRVSLFIGLGEVLYFGTRLASLFLPRFDQYLLLFDLVGIVVMAATILFAVPLLKTMQTIPHVYGETQ